MHICKAKIGCIENIISIFLRADGFIRAGGRIVNGGNIYIDSTQIDISAATGTGIAVVIYFNFNRICGIAVSMRSTMQVLNVGCSIQIVIKVG